jgi:hypothetical protein
MNEENELMEMYNLGFEHGRRLAEREAEIQQLKKEIEELKNE